MYDQITNNYHKIKEMYQSVADHNMNLHQHPFHPIMAFVSFEDPELARRIASAYRYHLGGIDFSIKG